MEDIFSEIRIERQRQNAIHGGPKNDDKLLMVEWIGIITRHLGLAVDDAKPLGGGMNNHSVCENPARYRRQMVRVAAVAVAAIEAFDRKVKFFDPKAKKSELSVEPENGSEAVQQKDETIDWWQGVADAAGQVMLLITNRNPALNREGPQGTYLVAEEVANQWEKKNYKARIEPKEGGK